MTQNLSPDLGPYETEQQAAATTRNAYAHPHIPGRMDATSRARLTAPSEAAGVELGAYDLCILAWLAKWEPEVVAVVAGVIARAGGAR